MAMKRVYSYMSISIIFIMTAFAFNNCGGSKPQGQLSLASTSGNPASNPDAEDPYIVPPDTSVNPTLNPSTPGGTGSGSGSGTSTSTNGGGTTQNPVVLNPAYQYVYSNPAWPLDNNCMTNTAFDACLIWKNPVAHRYFLSGNETTSIFYNSTGTTASPLTRGTDLAAITTMGVNLSSFPMASGGKLSNAFIDVFASNTATSSASYLRTVPVNGKYKFPYKTDTTYNLSQTMAFYWIHFAKKFFEDKGTEYPAAKVISGKGPIPVDAFNATNTGLRNNAYFAWANYSATATTPPSLLWGKVMLGRVSTSTSTGQEVIAHETAMSADIYIHEMGHANFYYAKAGYVQGANFGNDTNMVIESNNYFCTTSHLGCFSAINEGIADFQAFAIFEKQTGMMESFKNLAKGPLFRNPTYAAGFTAVEWYNRSPSNYSSSGRKGEIHYMGTVYASALYSLYMDPSIDKTKFLKIFMKHLAMLDSSSTFIGGKEALKFIDQVSNGGQYSSIIEAEFARRGLGGAG